MRSAREAAVAAATAADEFREFVRTYGALTNTE